MMQTFKCPWCGPREETEFRYGGEADKPRPKRDASVVEWAHYNYIHVNTKGTARELWIHIYGCGRWLVLERDTLTHEIKFVEPMQK
jgi:sarcosine oxidase subunit delta